MSDMTEHKRPYSGASLRQEKSEIREQMRAKRLAVDPAYQAEAEAKMAHLFSESVSFRFADTVLLYYPMSHELSLNAVAEIAFRKGKQVAYPRCEADGVRMDFHTVTSLDQLEKGRFGIWEPQASCPKYVCPEQCHDVCVVPAFTYDLQGYRIGYGKGYYDRWLSSFRGLKVGFVMQDFLSESLPHGRFDRVVDLIITERRVIKPHEA